MSRCSNWLFTANRYYCVLQKFPVPSAIFSNLLQKSAFESNISTASAHIGARLNCTVRLDQRLYHLVQLHLSRSAPIARGHQRFTGR